MQGLGRIALLGLSWPVLAAAQASEEQELAQAYGDSATISIATGRAQPLRRAPAVASVFTAEDIRAMGATDLSEVLDKVPGLNVSRSVYFYDPQYQFRGVGSIYSAQVLVLIDGMRRHSAFQGSAEELWAGMSTDNIARVEVIRGPGSALYGADAFAGVISITTKTANAVEGGHVGSLLSSHAGRELMWLQGWQVGGAGGLDVAAHVQVGRTRGADEVIAADAQSALDQVFGTRASLAPGPLQLGRQSVDASLRLGYGNWRLGATLKERRKVGTAVGVASALSPGDQVRTSVGTAELAYKADQVLPNLGLQFSLGLQHQSIDTYLLLFPAGAFGGRYPQGMIGAPGRATRQTQVSGIASYNGWQGHRVRFGLGVDRSNMYDTHERKNFDFQFVPGVGNFPVPLGQLVDVTTTNPYIRPQANTLSYVLVQDEWSFAPDWTLTAGLRHDHYSDSGGTTNPRLALVWEAAYNLTLKLLHGQAFRAPSFQERYITNNPVALGNPNLRPERMRTSEIALDWQAGTALQLSLNLFRYRMSDLLRYVPNDNPLTGSTAANLGAQNGHGLEAEMRWQARPGLRLVASYSYQRSVDELMQHRVGDVPRQMLKVGADWRLAADWSLNGQARHIAGRQRSAGDARPPVADYTLADLSLHWRREARSGWSLMAGLRNVFDADAREPSPAPGNIPNDLPLARRTWVLQGGYAF